MNIPIANLITQKNKRKKKKEKYGGHVIKCLLTELGRAGRENIVAESKGFKQTLNYFVFMLCFQIKKFQSL